MSESNSIRIESNGNVFLIAADGAVSVEARGQDLGVAHQVTELTARNRKVVYKHVPLVAPDGAPVTHVMQMSGGKLLMLRDYDAAAVIAARETAADAREAAAIAIRHRHFAPQLEEAKRTGKPVEVRRWVEGRERYESSLDLVVEFIRPDGTFFTRRSPAH